LAATKVQDYLKVFLPPTAAYLFRLWHGFAADGSKTVPQPKRWRTAIGSEESRKEA
jgi:hypothetical protein